MMPRKKRIAIIITAILVSILSIVGIFSYLYFNTDILKTDEELFGKYFMKNFNMIENLTNSELNNEINSQLNQNKYVSELTAKIEYTENINTTTENKDSVVNDIYLKVDSQIDKQNNYFYNDIKLVKEENNFIGFESILQNNDNYFRYAGIKQFLKIDETNIIDGLKSINEGTILQYLNINEEEKEVIKNNYLGIIRQYIAKDSYGKQKNAMITVNSQTVNANAYYLNITDKQIHEIKLQILEALKQDELILNKLEEIKNKLNTDENVKQKVIDIINTNIENIKQEEIKDSVIKITVYQSKGILIRTLVETETDRYIIDYIDKDTIYLERIEKENNLNKISLTIQNISSANNLKEIKITLNNINNDVILNTIVIETKQEKNDFKIFNTLNTSIYNEKNESKLFVTQNIEIVNEFKENIEEKLQNNIIDLNTLNENQKSMIGNIITKDIETKINQVDWNEYLRMIVKLFEVEEKVEIKDDNEIEETEKNRFNSNFEFFVGEGLSYNNIEDLMGYVKNNLNSIQINNVGSQESKEFVVTDIENKEDTQIQEYIKNIDNIVLNIEKNNNNIELSNGFLQLIEKMKDKKFNVQIEYNENKMVNKINIKVQNKQ